MSMGGDKSLTSTSNNVFPPRPDGVRLRARRNPRLVALGILLVCLGGLGAGFLYMNATHAQSVIMVGREIPRGKVITAADLRAVTVGSIPGVSVVLANQIDSLVGKTALIDLSAGSLLPATALGERKLPKGKALVGLKLGAGRAPHQELRAGRQINLIDVGDSAASGTKRVIPAVITGSPQIISDGQTLLVDVQVTETDASTLAALAAHDAVALVRLADR